MVITSLLLVNTGKDEVMLFRKKKEKHHSFFPPQELGPFHNIPYYNLLSFVSTGLGSFDHLRSKEV